MARIRQCMHAYLGAYLPGLSVRFEHKPTSTTPLSRCLPDVEQGQRQACR